MDKTCECYETDGMSKRATSSSKTDGMSRVVNSWGWIRQLQELWVLGEHVGHQQLCMLVE